MPDEHTREALCARETARVAALRGNDAGALLPLLHAELGYGHSSGVRDSRESLIAKLHGRQLEYLRLDQTAADIRIIGSTGIVVGEMSADIRLAGVPVSLHSVTQTTWVLDGGQWMLVAFHPTPLLKGPVT